MFCLTLRAIFMGPCVYSMIRTCYQGEGGVRGCSDDGWEPYYGSIPVIGGGLPQGTRRSHPFFTNYKITAQIKT